MSPLLVILSAAFGAATAGFLPRLVHRLAVGFAEPPRASCADCAGPFAPGAAGWVRVGAACHCSGRWVPPVFVGAAVCALLAATVGSTPLLPAYLVAGVLGLLLALIDLRCLRLPDRLVAALGVTVVLPLAVAHPAGLGRAVSAGVAVLVAYLLVAALPGGGLGLGDVKLAAVVATMLGFLGWPAVLVGLVVPHLINGPVALVLVVTRKVAGGQALPFGPALLCGALVGLVIT